MPALHLLLQKCQYSGGGAWLWRKFYVYLPFSNTLMVTTRKWCCSRCVNHVCRKERGYLEAAHLFPLHRIFFLPTGAEHFPLVLTSFFHRGVTSDLEFALTRLCSSQLFPRKVLQHKTGKYLICASLLGNFLVVKSYNCAKKDLHQIGLERSLSWKWETLSLY